MSKTLSKYVAAFDYVDKILLVLSARRSGVSIASLATVFGSLDQITSKSLSLVFSISNGTEWEKIKRKTLKFFY